MKLLPPPRQILAVSIVALLAQAAHADLTWNSAGPTNNWSTDLGDENWGPGPVVWTQGENAIFSGGAEAIDVTTVNVFDNLTFGVTGFNITNNGAGSLALANDLASTITVTSAPDSATISETIANNAGGVSSLTKAGLGTLNLTPIASNTFTGGVTVSAGTLAANVSTTLNAVGTGPLSIASGATLQLNNLNTIAATVTLANAITGSGLLRLNFSDTVATNTVLSGLGGFTGTVQLSNAGANSDKLNSTGIGTVNAALVIDSGSQLFVAANTAFTGGISINGTGNGENRGAIRLGGFTLGGNISLAGNASIGTEGGTLTGSITSGAAGTQTLTFGTTNSTGNATVTGAIGGGTGTIAIAKAAAGTVTFSGANTYTGTTTVTAGRLQFARPVALYNNVPANWTAANIIVNSGAALGVNVGGATDFTAADIDTLKALGTATGGFRSGAILALDTTNALGGAFTYASTISNPNAGANALGITKVGAGTLTLSASNTHTGGTTVSGGTLVAANTGAFGAAGRIVSFGAAGTVLELATDAGMNANILNQGSNTGAVTLRVSRATPGAAVTHTLGNLTQGINDNITVASGTNNTGTPVVNFGLWQLTSGVGNGSSTMSPTTADVSFTGVQIPSGSTLKTAIFDGTSAGSIVTGPMTSGPLAGAVLSVVKTGAGTWTFAGANTHTGTTAVNAGTLRLSYATQDNSKLPDGAALTLAGGTIELSDGTHTEIVGSTTLANGSLSRITRPSGGAVLALGTVTPGSGAVNFSADNIATTNNLNTSGILPWARFGNIWGANATDVAGGFIAAYTGTLDDVTRLGASTIPDGAGKNVRVINGGVAGNIGLGASPQTTINSLLVDASDGPATIGPAAATDVFAIGNAAVGTVWQTATSGGLTIGAAAGDGVLTSGASGAATLTLINDSTVNALTIQSNIGDNAGPGAVSVSAGGAGSVVLKGTNNFTGSLAVGAGSLTIADPGSLGGGAYAGTIANAGTLTYASSNNQVLSGIISGAGTLVQSGTGSMLTLAAANTYTGVTRITDGTIIAGTGTALGTVAGGTIINGGGTLDVNGQNLTTEIFTVSGAGVGGGGAIINNGAAQINATGRIVLAGDTVLGGNSRWDLRNSTPTLNMNGFTITKEGPNQISLIGVAVSNPGHVLINNGSFGIETTTNVGGSAANTVTIQPFATLIFYQNANVIPWSIIVNGGTVSQNLVTTTASGPVTLGGATNTVNVAGTSLTLTGVVSGGLLQKTGAGLLVLNNAANDFVGGTVIDGGALRANGDGALGASSAAVEIDNNAILQAGANLTTTERTITLGNGAGRIDTNGFTVNLDTGSGIIETIPSTLTKIGNGTLRIAGTQNYSTLTASAGTTNLKSALGTGTSILNANATVNIGVSQTLAELNIGDGAVVTLDSALAAPDFAAPFDATLGAAAVPEPASATLLLGGLLTLLCARRRRKVE